MIFKRKALGFIIRAGLTDTPRQPQVGACKLLIPVTGEEDRRWGQELASGACDIWEAVSVLFTGLEQTASCSLLFLGKAFLHQYARRQDTPKPG